MLARAQTLSRLDALIGEFMHAALRKHAVVANLRESTLVMLVDGPVWKSRLRLDTPVLLEKLQQAGMEVTDIKINVTTEPLPVPLELPARRERSASYKDQLQSVLALLDDGAAQQS